MNKQKSALTSERVFYLHQNVISTGSSHASLIVSPKAAEPVSIEPLMVVDLLRPIGMALTNTEPRVASLAPFIVAVTSVVQSPAGLIVINADDRSLRPM